LVKNIFIIINNWIPNCGRYSNNKISSLKKIQLHKYIKYIFNIYVLYINHKQWQFKKVYSHYTYVILNIVILFAVCIIYKYRYYIVDFKNFFFKDYSLFSLR